MSTGTVTSRLTELDHLAARVRYRIAEMIYHSGTMHLGSSWSCTDILVALYWDVLNIDPGSPEDPDRDRMILSKGHAAPALFAALALRGFFDESRLDTYCQNGSKLAEHPTPGCAPGVEAATGSLGHGLSLGLGMAYSARLQERDYRVYAVLSDGECNEGSTWEAAMLAPALGLDNLCAVIDFNKWQATGRSQEVMKLDPLADKWESFGWNTSVVDGHDIGELIEVLREVPDGSGQPVAIVADTVKGRGVSFIEDDNNWHYRQPTKDELAEIREELGLA